MKLRIASIAFLLGSLTTGLSWLALQPSLLQLIALSQRLVVPGSAEAQWLSRTRQLLPLYLGLTLALAAATTFLVLYVMVARPLRQAEGLVDQIARLELTPALASSAGPLLSRLQGALKRMAEALAAEQSLTRAQVQELRQANQKLQQAQMELVAAERLATVGKLAAGVAHEVGNPLAGILGYLSVARSRSKSEEVNDLLGRIDAEVQRIDQIVRGLLDLGRPAKGQLQPVALKPLVDSAVRLVSAGPDFRDVSVEVRIDGDPVARAESGPLSQVLLNLLLNAAQAMSGRGTIVVSGRVEASSVVLEVKDSGPGISAEVRDRLFEPFVSSKPAGQGTGLGLAISRHLVSAMGGALTGDNAPEGGARFTIRLTAAVH